MSSQNPRPQDRIRVWLPFLRSLARELAFVVERGGCEKTVQREGREGDSRP